MVILRREYVYKIWIAQLGITMNIGVIITLDHPPVAMIINNIH